MPSFEGQINVSPPLNAAERSYLSAFADTRHMYRVAGPYYVGDDESGDSNRECPEQPGIWCDWVSNEDGTALVHNGREKFHSSTEWMRYLIDTFFRRGASLQRELMMMNAVPARSYSPLFREFIFGHEFDGVIQGYDEGGERWNLVVKDSVAAEVPY